MRLGLTSSPEIERSAVEHGHDLLVQGFTVSQVVHDYGDVCQAITELAVETNASISTEDFQTLNRCLDDAIVLSGLAHGGRRRSIRAVNRHWLIAHCLEVGCPRGPVRDAREVDCFLIRRLGRRFALQQRCRCVDLHTP